MTENLRADRDRAVMLSLVAPAAMAFAYLLVWAVLSDPHMTDKMMNGVVPPGTVAIGNRVAVGTAILAALGGCTAALASQRILPVLLVMIAAVPLTPMTLFTLALVL